ncbi:NnrU family protein [Pseudoroseicyclus tamaricis]|uniref:NnrU family protein n=1 Tax=Pseudoroseicyclus tamaricis TaxID=2705421 RepID=A0A6B2JPN0_9RHOB|nr:NnrU family protein [Pseudoroseicyclus tamaricis]NDU99959.1 NnrU family protein [Pseudoroseicyclus tamaricis]
MGWLILGVLLWSGAHLMRRLAPGLRARLGEGPGKGVIALASLIGIVLMVIGYGDAAYVPVYQPPAFLRHLNWLLMLLAVILINLQFSRGVLRTKLRHPMLNAVKTWAIAHLLVRGDLASIILFGGLFAWALANMILINRQQPEWTRPPRGPWWGDAIYVVISVVVYVVVVYIHGWLGPSPFGGM